jgi:hypothetical protein
VLHPEPESAHVTPLFAESPVTVALNVVVAFTPTVAVVCDKATETPAAPAPIVIAADAVFVPSVTDVATSVAVAGFGAVAGAVYVTAVPDALEVAESDPQAFGVAQEIDHVTPLLALSFATVAVRLCVPPSATVAVVGVTLTAIAADPPPPGGVVLFDPPPHPATNVTTSATASTATKAAKFCETAHIHRQPLRLCARTMTLLPFGPSLGSVAGQFVFFSTPAGITKGRAVTYVLDQRSRHPESAPLFAVAPLPVNSRCGW